MSAACLRRELSDRVVAPPGGCKGTPTPSRITVWRTAIGEDHRGCSRDRALRLIVAVALVILHHELRAYHYRVVAERPRPAPREVGTDSHTHETTAFLTSSTR
jgi:hypothetical protein